MNPMKFLYMELKSNEIDVVCTARSILLKNIILHTTKKDAPLYSIYMNIRSIYRSVHGGPLA